MFYRWLLKVSIARHRFWPKPRLTSPAPIKRKADEVDQVSSEQGQKRARNEEPNSTLAQATIGAHKQRQIVAGLKEKLRELAQRQHIPLDIHGRDPQRDVYAFELRAMLRQKAVGRWTCPAFDCNQSYTRKSHMKGHIMTSMDVRHGMVRSILSEIRCCYCGDEARDIMIIAQQQNKERFEAGHGFLSRVTEIAGEETPRQMQADLRTDGESESQASASAPQERTTSMAEDDQEAHISKIVEDLSRSNNSDTEVTSVPVFKVESPASASIVCREYDPAQHDCSPSPSCGGSPTSIEVKGTRSSHMNAQDELLTGKVDHCDPNNDRIRELPDGSTPDSSSSRFMDSTDHAEVSIQKPMAGNSDSYGTKLSGVVRQRNHPKRPTPISRSKTSRSSYLDEISSHSIAGLGTQLRSQRYIQPDTAVGPLFHQSTAIHPGSLDWQSMPQPSYVPSQQHQYWITAGNPSYNPSFPASSLDPMYGAGYTGYCNDSLELSEYAHQPKERIASQPPPYGYPHQSYPANSQLQHLGSRTVPDHLSKDTMSEELGNHLDYVGGFDYPCSTDPRSPEVVIKQSPSLEQHSLPMPNGEDRILSQGYLCRKQA